MITGKHRYLEQFLILLTVFGLGFNLVCCGKSEKHPAEDQSQEEEIVVAKVNGEPILLAELNRHLLPIKYQFRRGTPPQAEQNLPKVQREILNKLIDQKLILQQARKLRISISPSELQEELDKLKSIDPSGEVTTTRFPPNNDQNWLADFKNNLIVNKTLDKHAEVRITGLEARAYYDADQHEFYQPTQVRVRQIMVETEREARDILKQLQRGENFAKLARTKSLSPDGEKDGDLGYFSPGLMPKEFDKAVFLIEKKGQISDVVQSRYGYHIFKLIDRKEPYQLSFEEVEEQIRRRLKQEKQEQAAAVWLAQLWGKSAIKINPYLLEKP